MCTFRTIAYILLSALSAVSAGPAFCATPGHGLDHIGLAQVTPLFPAATSLEPRPGEYPVLQVRGDAGGLGYVYLSDLVAPMPAYSGRPVSLLVGLDTTGLITGVRLVHHEEPILVIGITDQNLQQFTDQYRGIPVRQPVRINAFNRPGFLGVDGITGATITAMVMNSSIMKSAKLIADQLGLPLPTARVEAESHPGGQPGTAASGQERHGPAAGTTATFQPPPVETDPVWVERWRQEVVSLAVLGVALMVLLAILFFQDWLVVRPVLFHRVRLAYLLFTLLCIGILWKAQLSVINLVAFMRVFAGGFTWETLLIDPIIFALWAFVAVSIILWGRGVFCGWLCPFGAAQELIHKAAEKLKFPSWEFPSMVHERLWAIKYFLLIGIVGLSLESMRYASTLAEIEPFKTVFVLEMQREWPYVLFAATLLVIAAFNSKFYCKYLCPLGAGLSFFTRFRIFDWLRRRKECGSPCQVCASRCQISSIKPTGEIIDNECHYCLECQVVYWDDRQCPPLVDKRKRREARSEKSAPLIASDLDR